MAKHISGNVIMGQGLSECDNHQIWVSLMPGLSDLTDPKTRHIPCFVCDHVVSQDFSYMSDFSYLSDMRFRNMGHEMTCLKASRL